MFLTEEEHNLLNTVRYLVGKNLAVNQAKMLKFMKLVPKMKDETNKDILENIKEKSSNNKTMTKVQFLKDMLGMSSFDFFDRTLGLTFSLNVTMLLITILMILMSNKILINSIVFILLQIYYFFYKGYKMRSLIFVRNGAINTSEIIRLYNNSSIFDKIVPVALIPNYKKLYIKNMAESKLVKILEDKLVTKKDLNEWTDWMQIPSKIGNFYDTMIKIMKILAVIMVIIFALRMRMKVNNSIVKLRNLVQGLRSFGDYKIKVEDLFEKINQMNEMINKMKNTIEIGSRATINSIKEQVNTNFDKIAQNLSKMKEEINTHPVAMEINRASQLLKNKTDEMIPFIKNTAGSTFKLLKEKLKQ
jgi:uncharacterized protein YdcH (DUF465 family)